MKKEIKVYLQYPWKYSDSPYYKYLIENPPENTVYMNTLREKGATYSKKRLKRLYFVKTQIRKWTRKLNLAIPNVHLSRKGDYDLIHCAHCLSKNRDKPWVTDIEGKWSLFISGQNKEGVKKVERLLNRGNCKKVLPWTEKSKEELLKMIPSIETKMEVVYPAIPKREDLTKKPTDRINLLFSGRYFFQKGGLHAIEVMDKLTKKYKNVYGFFISSIPKEILKKYSGNKKISFHELMPQEELFRLMNKSHIFLYPGYSDSFGFGFLEAMSFGLVTITVDGSSRKEIITEGKTGFVIDVGDVYQLNRELITKKERDVVLQLTKKVSLLIENPKLLKKMSENCLKEISKEKFSIKERDKKLNKIYREALK